MRTENVQKNRVWKKEVYTEALRGLTEWELEYFQQTIDQAKAKAQNKIITFSVWGSEKYVQWTGIIQALNTDKQELTLENISKIKHIPIHTIHAARLDDSVKGWC